MDFYGECAGSQARWHTPTLRSIPIPTQAKSAFFLRPRWKSPASCIRPSRRLSPPGILSAVGTPYVSPARDAIPSLGCRKNSATEAASQKFFSESYRFPLKTLLPKNPLAGALTQAPTPSRCALHARARSMSHLIPCDCSHSAISIWSHSESLRRDR